MFSKVKQIFSKPKKQRKNSYQTTEVVSFKDLTGKLIKLEIKTNGNDSMLLIQDKEDLFTLDQEGAVLLSVLLQSYSIHGIFPNLDNEKGE